MQRTYAGTDLEDYLRIVYGEKQNFIHQDIRAIYDDAFKAGLATGVGTVRNHLMEIVA
jgi:hypothetical protein